MDELLKDSVFYPASRTDGRPIQLCNTVWRRLGVNSFVYCDFDLSEREFIADTRTMHGYHVIGYRHLDPCEYIPKGWRLEMAPERGNGRRGGYWDTFLGGEGPEHCACWAVFERDADMSPVHGPERLSVLFVCGEGLATFQQLYCSRRMAPKMLCFIQCWGFAGNWTNFSGVRAPFHRTLLKYKESTPEWLCFGDCCGIHGAIRLRGLDYAGVRCLGYRALDELGSRFGVWPLRSKGGHTAYEFFKGGRRFLAVSVSHQMAYAVYDITGCRMDPDELLEWLILTDPGRTGGHDSYLNEWVGVKGMGRDGTPVLDEKLEWRRLDWNEMVARAMAVVGSVTEVYGHGVRAYTPLVKAAMLWARGVLAESYKVIQPNGMASPIRYKAYNDCGEWLTRLPSYRLGVSANMAFGRG